MALCDCHGAHEHFTLALEEENLLKLTYDVWEQQNRFNQVANKVQYTLLPLNRLASLAEFMYTPNAAQQGLSQKYGHIGLNLHCPKRCRPHNVTLMVACRKCRMCTGFLHPLADDADDTQLSLGLGGSASREILVAIMAPLFPPTGGATSATSATVAATSATSATGAIPESSSTLRSQQPPPPPPQDPPPQSQQPPPPPPQDHRHRAQPALPSIPEVGPTSGYQCFYANASRSTKVPRLEAEPAEADVPMRDQSPAEEWLGPI